MRVSAYKYHVCAIFCKNDTININIVQSYKIPLQIKKKSSLDVKSDYKNIAKTICSSTVKLCYQRWNYFAQAMFDIVASDLMLHCKSSVCLRSKWLSIHYGSLNCKLSNK